VEEGTVSQEARKPQQVISERVLASTLIAKSRGSKFGLQLRSKSWQRDPEELEILGLSPQDADTRAGHCISALMDGNVSRVFKTWRTSREERGNPFKEVVTISAFVLNSCFGAESVVERRA